MTTIAAAAAVGWTALGWLAWRYRSAIWRANGKPGATVPAGIESPRPSLGNIAGEDQVSARRLPTASQDFSAVESVTDLAIAVLDTEGRLTGWNAGAERITGYPRHEIVGKHYSMLYPAPAREAASRGEQLRLAAELGRFEYEGIRVRKDGSEFRANCVTTLATDVAGQRGGFCEISRELADRKGEPVQLEAAIERAEAADRAKSEFLAVISHEIRTPMNVILGMADLLHASSLDAQQRRFVDVFRRASNGLLGLINDVLDLSKIESGRLELEQTEFDVTEVAQQSLELIAQRARVKGIVLDADVPAAATKLLGDSARLRQVLLNLLGNAIKFTDTGSVRLTIVPHGSGEAGHFEFRVKDTGIGIAEDKLPAIFEDFTQADSSFARKYGGTGLGLGISRRLVRLMGGELTASSELGRGSVFRFDARFQVVPGTVAIAPNAQDLKSLRAALTEESSPVVQASGTASGTASGRIARSRILIAEDSDDNRLLLELYLNGTDYAFELAENGKAAVDLFASRDFDIVLMDLQMPVMDGLTAAQWIRTFESESGREPTPILAFTASTRGAELRKSLVAGCNGYLTKPLSKAGLLAALERYGPSRVCEDRHSNPDSNDVKALVPKYLKTRRKELEHLATLLDDREFGQIRTIAHNLKGTGAPYGFPRLTTLGGAMQLAAEASDFRTLDGLFVELADYLWSCA